MKFGFSISAMVQQAKGRDMEGTLADIITWVHRARDLGYDYVYTGQHYLTAPYQALQPIPLLARLAPEAGQMRLVATLVMPLFNPVELAETLGTLDVITGGRFTLTAGLGYRDEEYAAFNVDKSTRVSRMTECLQCLRMLWTQDRVTFHGKHFNLKDASVVLRPVQKPHPPIWIAANADPAVARAGRLGLPWHINPHATTDHIRRQVAIFREAAAAAGHDPNVPLPLNRELYCAPTREQAFREAEPFLYGKYQAYAQWGQDRALPGQENFRVSFEELARDRFIIGSPDDCAREMEKLVELGIGYAHFRMAWAGMPLEEAIRGMDLLASRVMPRFR